MHFQAPSVAQTPRAPRATGAACAPRVASSPSPAHDRHSGLRAAFSSVASIAGAPRVAGAACAPCAPQAPSPAHDRHSGLRAAFSSVAQAPSAPSATGAPCFAEVAEASQTSKLSARFGVGDGPWL